MPKIDGVEFLRIIRNKKEFEKLPIVVCSVVENADTVRQVMEFGISDFVAKPVDRVTLSKKLTKIIHSHKKDQGVAENPIFVE
jgi:YesN/AraC family two-component response regulator